jgi:hypothetical protein
MKKLPIFNQIMPLFSGNSGRSATQPIDAKVLTNARIQLACLYYSDCPEPLQLWEDFTHNGWVFGLPFNCDRDAHRYTRYVHP